MVEQAGPTENDSPSAASSDIDWTTPPPLIDVRSPAEFAQGHIPGARNVPLFSDEERATVGTLYKKKGREAALDKGLELVGPKLAFLVTEIRQHGGCRPLIYCWRGGMRSGAVCGLMQIVGLSCGRLAGGYKAYRRHIRAFFTKPAPLLVVGGYTGSGKTILLHRLAQQGLQIVDLEGLAHHKGSVFGHINEQQKPSNEQFENNLFAAMQGLDSQRFILVENESRVIGKVHLPEPFYEQLRSAPLISLDVPQEARISRLVADYATTDKEELLAAARSIQKKLGRENLRRVEEHIVADNYGAACAILLGYYDVYYDRGVSRRSKESIYPLSISGTDLEADVSRIKEKIASLAIACRQEPCHA